MLLLKELNFCESLTALLMILREATMVVAVSSWSSSKDIVKLRHKSRLVRKERVTTCKVLTDTLIWRHDTCRR